MLALLRTAYEKEVSKRGNSYQDDPDTARHIQLVAKWLVSDTLKPSLLLYGGIGNGKTTMIRAITSAVESLKDSARKYMKENNPAEESFSVIRDNADSKALKEIIKFPTIKAITAQKLAELASQNVDAFSKLKGETFLVIDDLGCEPTAVKNYGTEVTPVTDVIYQRYDKILPTIITTNLDRKDIRQQYGDRVADRFNEMFELIAFNNGTYRK